ncbi:helix-turn-helix domain-containing protein [uncultured Eubacterium sp.]|uniref:helix-turn-helix domain-containing protein n=1 Tax=uncultured Eubacterium sp. TaxID=165185 RepID=UPI00258BBB5A|nr:helix-turn-helix transcriptional regulator [uncultured Eubacterium sp.]
MDLGQRLKQFRTEKHLSQETVAFELNVSRQAVAKWENNASKPSTANLMAICDLYGISLDELISNKSDELSAEQTEPNKSKVKTAIVILSVVGGILLILSVILTVWTKRMSVPDNIIGYADAPTAIFATSSLWFLYVLYMLVGIHILTIITLLLKIKKK